ncbi:MAG TPA: hypothetical protein VEC37_00445 [Bacillota bacterium]|nr:hypothetical protein [Bacillota bacterium]
MPEFYNQNIIDCEKLIITNLSTSANPEPVLRQASILKKFLQDIWEEGYEYTYRKFCDSIKNG